MDWIIALVALAAMEIVLGIDNIVFIAIVTDKLPIEQQPRARRLGLALAMIARIGLLLTLKWIMGLEDPIFRLTQLGIPESWFGHGEHAEAVIVVSWKDLIPFLVAPFRPDPVGGKPLFAQLRHEPLRMLRFQIVFTMP